MEQLIILAVIGLLSTLFSKKNKSDSPKQGTPQKMESPQRPPMQQQSPQKTATPQRRQASSTEQMDPFKRLKELTGEIYKEIQEDQRKSPAEQPVPVKPVEIPQVPKQRKKATSEPVLQSRPSYEHAGRPSGRLSAHNPEQDIPMEQHSIKVDIASEEDLLKGFIFSEILGPPKSKR